MLIDQQPQKGHRRVLEVDLFKRPVEQKQILPVSGTGVHLFVFAPFREQLSEQVSNRRLFVAVVEVPGLLAVVAHPEQNPLEP